MSIPVGADDSYAIYGNFLPEHHGFQGEGNIALYSNLFYNSRGDAVCVQPHNDVPRRIYIFNNTVVAQGTGIKVVGADSAYPQKLMANAVFAAHLMNAGDEPSNITKSFASVGRYLINPGGSLGQFNLARKLGEFMGGALDMRLLSSFPDWDRDFDGERRLGHVRGAYAKAPAKRALADASQKTLSDTPSRIKNFLPCRQGQRPHHSSVRTSRRSDISLDSRNNRVFSEIRACVRRESDVKKL